jgi:histidyl-tRNA synthetase
VRIKPSIPKGTRDFSPVEMKRRNVIFSTIRTVFEQFGFQSIETPAMENLNTLSGKYGEEGDRLIFKVLNSGDYLQKADESAWSEKNSGKFTTSVSEKALRYDLTVPFARYVVQHQNEISFPFRRYQMQAVWRADRPQKGRYREFYQCDADVIGSDSLILEAELLCIFQLVFTQLKLDVKIKLNNRKILKGLTEVMGEEARFVPITVILDKLDKIGLEKVMNELLELGISNDAQERLNAFIAIQGEKGEKMKSYATFFEGNEIGSKGVGELSSVLNYLEKMEGNSNVMLDGLLARGLDYYTGAIFEVLPANNAVGSVCGGGRYDDLTGIFGLNGVSGVGISFGVDRIYDALMYDGWLDEESSVTTQVLFVNFGGKESLYALQAAQLLRTRAEIKVEVYPDPAKMKKQMKYADDKQIPYVILAGSDEIKNQRYTLKNMKTGQQDQMDIEKLLKTIKTNG